MQPSRIEGISEPPPETRGVLEEPLPLNGNRVLLVTPE